MVYVDTRPYEQRRSPRVASHAPAALLFGLEVVILRLASAYFSDGLVGFVFTLTMLIAGTPLFSLLRRGPALPRHGAGQTAKAAVRCAESAIPLAGRRTKAQ